jgi:hypothetical protein
MYKLVLQEGKYEIHLSPDLKVFKSLRYGEEWRDLTGDNLILALVCKIEEQEIEIKNLTMG